MYKMRVGDSEMSMRCNKDAWSILDISVQEENKSDGCLTS